MFAQIWKNFNRTLPVRPVFSSYVAVVKHIFQRFSYIHSTFFLSKIFFYPQQRKRIVVKNVRITPNVDFGIGTPSIIAQLLCTVTFIEVARVEPMNRSQTDLHSITCQFMPILPIFRLWGSFQEEDIPDSISWLKMSRWIWYVLKLRHS